MRQLLRELWVGEAGVTTVEYALLLALVALGAVLAFYRLGRHERRTIRIINRLLRPP